MTDLEKRAKQFWNSWPPDCGGKSPIWFRDDLLAEIEWARENPPPYTQNYPPALQAWREMADHLAACLGKEKK